MSEFIKNALSSESNVSSKRFNGTIGFQIYILLTIIISMIDLFKDWKLENYSVTLLTTLAWITATLLGVSKFSENNKLIK